jgi:23S rRNA pseudouridine1911/1915/1917 synthase
MNIKPLIIAETDNWVVLNKPSGLLSIPDREGKTDSLKSYLATYYPQIFTVHRLDKDTSGLILFAKNAESHKLLTQMFEQRSIQKMYLALVNNSPNPAIGTVKNNLREHYAKKGTYQVASTGKEAITHYNTIETFKNYSLLQCNIETGRTHQIRVHCQYLGCPIVADNLYGDGKAFYLSSVKKKFNLSKNSLEETPILSRLALHAATLNFTDPLTNIDYALEAPLLKDMAVTLKQLKKL